VEAHGGTAVSDGVYELQYMLTERGVHA
jgi:hypothetical protein